MDFAGKLSFLMRLTNTSNSALAKYVALDPSHISRLRRGERNLPANDNYADLIAGYLAKQCHQEYQRIALRNTMKNEAIGMDISLDKLAALIQKWFVESDTESSEKTGTVSSLLTDFSRLVAPQSPPDEKDSARNEMVVYYGKEGKRQATIALLNMLLNKKTPGQLLLFSDESAEWMLENPAFYDAWCTLLSQIILKGHKIKIIHKVSRDIDEMLNVIRQWLPLYITGSVEPYYYPKLRDGVYKRSLTVSPGLAAIVSSSVGENTMGVPNLMMTDKGTVDSFTNEFYSYLALCKPLIKINTGKSKEEILSSIMQFEAAMAPVIATFNSLPAITIPTPTLRSALARGGNSFDEPFFDMYRKWSESFKAKLQGYPACHIIRIHTPEEVFSGSVAMKSIRSLSGFPLYYTPKDYASHLKSTLDLIKGYDNYDVILTFSGDEKHALKAAEEQGAQVINDDVNPFVFEINESNMSAAFWDYMQNIRSNNRAMNRQTVINTMEALIQAL